MTNKPKGIRIDGKKLRDLRTKEGKTQKGVIAGSTVQLRTYQRAEHGQLILPDLAEQIARLFKVELKAIRVDKAKDDEALSNSYRLHNLIAVGAVRFFEALQGGNGKPRYVFKINPGTQIAEDVAAFIEFCDTLVIDDSSQYEWRLEPARAIRVIGELNDRAAALAALGIQVFFGLYTEWEIRRDGHITINADVTGGDPIVPYNVAAHSKFRVDFSPEEAPFLTSKFSSYHTIESANERALNANLKLQIRPEWMPDNPFIFDEEFHARYREAYQKKYGSIVMLSPPAVEAANDTDQAV